jgi:predicted phosphoribosyltransferase
LSSYRRRDDVVVLALPRGGVPVGYEVALALGAPLDLFLVRKVGLPGHEELAIGAVAEGGIEILNEDLIRDLRLAPDVVAAAVAKERAALAAREGVYRDLRSARDLRGHTLIVVDDGLATGMSMAAAVQALRTLAPAAVVVAVPVGAAETCARFRAIADAVVCAEVPPYFEAVGLWYENFRQTEDAEVAALLAAGRARPGPSHSP